MTMKLFPLIIAMACIYCALAVVIVPKHVDSANFWAFAIFMALAIVIVLTTVSINSIGKPDDYDRSTL